MIAEYTRYYQILQIFVINRLKTQYRRSTIGFFWSSLGPLLMLTLLSTIFSVILQVPFFEFMIFLFAGYMPWRFFSQTMNTSISSLLASEGLIRKVRLPIILFPISLTTSGLLDFLLGSIFFYLILFFILFEASLSLLFLPVAVFLLYFFVLGMCLIISTIGIYFRDMQMAFVILVQGLFYATPVLYDLKLLAERGIDRGIFTDILTYNPLTYYINLFRSPIVEHTLPSSFDLMITSSITLGTFTVGYFIFYKFRHSFVFRI